MNASQAGGKDWWRVVQSMPIEEALIHLNDYRSTLMACTAGKSEYINATAQITKINNEIKRLNRVQDNARWYNACRNVLDQEQFDAVLVEKRRLEREAEE